MSSIKASKFGLNSSENTSIIITANDLDMSISANGKEAIHIDSNARVGLQTTTPNATLDISGSGSGSVFTFPALLSLSPLDSYPYALTITNRNAVSNSGLGIYVENDGNTHFDVFKNLDIITFSNTQFQRVQAIYLKSNISDPMLFYVGGTEKLNISPSGFVNVSGNVVTTGSIRDDVGDVRDIGINNQSASYGLLEADAGKVIALTTGNVFVPPAVFSAGQAVSVYNNSAASITITQNSSVTMYLAGTATTGNRTLAQRGVATILCVAANTFVISGGGLT